MEKSKEEARGLLGFIYDMIGAPEPEEEKEAHKDERHLMLKPSR